MCLCISRYKYLDVSVGLNGIMRIKAAISERLAYEYNGLKEMQKMCGERFDAAKCITTVESHIRLYEDVKHYIIANNIQNTTERMVAKTKPNDKCTCGSGKKFKKCCSFYVL